MCLDTRAFSPGLLFVRQVTEQQMHTRQKYFTYTTTTASKGSFAGASFGNDTFVYATALNARFRRPTIPVDSSLLRIQATPSLSQTVSDYQLGLELLNKGTPVSVALSLSSGPVYHVSP